MQISQEADCTFCRTASAAPWSARDRRSRPSIGRARIYFSHNTLYGCEKMSQSVRYSTQPAKLSYCSSRPRQALIIGPCEATWHFTGANIQDKRAIRGASDAHIRDVSTGCAPRRCRRRPRRWWWRRSLRCSGGGSRPAGGAPERGSECRRRDGVVQCVGAWRNVDRFDCCPLDGDLFIRICWPRVRVRQLDARI